MVKTTKILLNELSEYSDPFGKINRLLKAEELFLLKKGFYETDRTKPGYLFAPIMYGPSYLSFDYALSRHGLIPEAVHEYTSATFNKGKRKRYQNIFGDYSYRDVPKAAYPFEVQLYTEGDYAYMMATPEKAICDKLYTLPPVSSIKEITQILFENLRIDETEFQKLNIKTLEELSELYKSNNIRYMIKTLKKAQK